MSREPLLTYKAAAAELTISPRTLRRIVEQGAIRYVQVSPRRIAFKPADLTEYLQRVTREREAATCRSTSQKARRTGTSTSSSKVVAFTALQAARRKRTPDNSRR